VHLLALATKRLIGAAAISAALMATLAAPASSAPGAVGSPPRCATSKLAIWLDTQGSGAAGSVYYHLKLTNLSGRACTLRGYPGVSAVSLAGRQLGRAAARDSVHQPKLVTLANASSASVVLRIVAAANFPIATCRPVTAAGLRVYPPNETAAKVVPFPFRACSRSGPVYLSVEAVQKA
jgi:hypothetical protein